MLRHFRASQLYAHGMDLVAIQEVLGHSWIITRTAEAVITLARKPVA
jgi:site-specific recombinase XerD